MNRQRLIYCAGNGAEIHELYIYFLVNNCRTTLCEKIEELNSYILKEIPDGIIINFEGIGKNEIEVLLNLRNEFDGPLIVFGRKIFTMKHIELIDAGADDYMDVDEEPAIILARLNALWDRIHPGRNEEAKIFNLNEGRLVINEHTHQTLVDGREVSLTFREWNVLLYLVKYRTRAVSRKELLEHSLDYQFEGYNRILDTYIRNIRKKINVPDCIETIRGYGYRYNSQVMKISIETACG